MGIEQIQMAETKALLPASWFNWGQIGVSTPQRHTGFAQRFPFTQRASSRYLAAWNSIASSL